MQLDGYSDLLKIGEGGMAHVYRGVQDSLQRPVAIKLLINDLKFDEEARGRFERESYIIARLNHANIIHVIDRGITDGDKPYFVMEYIEGLDLVTAAKSREITHTEKIDIIIQVLKALSYAHKNNVIHRDIKPDNILIDDEGHVKILDFGIAQFYDEKVSPDDRTITGTVMGTYNYMSPEQRVSSDNVTEKSDLYSVGVVMYELFTGRIPLGVFPEPSRLNGDIGPELDKLILKSLSLDAGDRPASAEELKNELLAISQGSHIGEEQKLRAEQGIAKIKSKFLLLDILREDKFGATYLYQKKDRGNLLIIKKKASTSSGFEVSNLLASLEHENIVNTLGTSRNDRFFILVQEYLSGGTLLDKLAFQTNWHETLNIAKQICQAMIFSHTNRIVHGHLRPNNILFTAENQVKITDFCLQDDATTIDNAHYYCLAGEERSTVADIYAVGVILYQLFTGCLPRREGETTFTVREFFAKLPEDLQEVIVNMISIDPTARLPNSLQKTVELLDNHLGINDNESFTDKPLRDRNRSTDQERDQNQLNRSGFYRFFFGTKDTSSVSPRMSFLFGIVVVLFAQYLFMFDGQQKINQVMPSVYNKFVNQFEGLLGKTGDL